MENRKFSIYSDLDILYHQENNVFKKEKMDYRNNQTYQIVITLNVNNHNIPKTSESYCFRKKIINEQQK